MFWAQTESHLPPYGLAQSGMPVPELPGFALEGSELLGYPSVEAQPALEARLGELFGLAPERVLATIGASGAMHLAAEVWMRGSRVISETPSYEPLRALPVRAGAAEILRIERTLDAGWAVDPDHVAALAAAGRGPCHLFLTNPHNPSGALLDAPTIVALARAIEPTDGVLISNEVYMEYAPSDDQRVHAALLAPNAISLGSLTKAYGLGPLRSGWILLGEGLAEERARLVDHQYLTTVDLPTPSMNAARAALARMEELRRPLRRVEAQSRPHLLRWLEESRFVEATVPPFGILAFPRVSGVEDTRELARYLAAEHEVGVVAGEHFDAPGHLRIGCGVPEETVVEGLRRLEEGLGAFAGTRADD